MPDANARPRKQVVAAAMFLSAVVMFAVSMSILTGVVELGDDIRVIAASAVGIAALADLLVAIWFFRQGQSL